MSCFELYSQNLLDQATLTASTTNALFPVANIQDYRRSKVWRSTTNSDNVVIDFGETSPVENFIIVPDKRTGFGISTITLQFNGTDSWGTPAHTEAITFSTELGVGYKSFSTQSYRFCRVVVTSTLGYCELSHFFIGVKDNLTRGINFGWSLKDDELSTKKSNRYGQIFSDLLIRQKAITASLSLMDKTDTDIFQSFLDRCGETKPFYLKIGDDEMSADFRRTTGMFFLNDIPTIVNPNYGRYNTSFSAREAT